MKKLLILSLFAVGSMFARSADACPTVYVSEIPTCQELRLVTVPAQREVYYSCPAPSDAHASALSVFQQS
jgi:hypothetical protein